MYLTGHPGQIKEIYQYGDPTIANYTSSDLRRGSFGKSDGHNPLGTIRS